MADTAKNQGLLVEVDPDSPNIALAGEYRVRVFFAQEGKTLENKISDLIKIQSQEA